MAMETQAVAQRLRMLQNNFPYPPAPSMPASVPEKTLYPLTSTTHSHYPEDLPSQVTNIKEPRTLQL